MIGSGSGEKSSSGSSSVIPPIHTFENNQDYLYDIAWSPADPALFACGDGQANVDLWEGSVLPGGLRTYVWNLVSPTPQHKL